MMIEVSSPPESARTIFSDLSGIGVSAPCRKADRGAAQQPNQYSFLNVQAVFGLIKDHRVNRIHYLIGNFLSAMRRQAVHESCVWLSQLHERGIYLVWSKNSCTFLGFVFLSHTRPGIGINGIRPSDGFSRVGHNA